VINTSGVLNDLFKVIQEIVVSRLMGNTDPDPATEHRKVSFLESIQRVFFIVT
jgi:hypothetical protein